jgi:hypothetical protein
MSPLYTYRCAQGHEWDEVRGVSEDSSVSTDPCQTCVEAAEHYLGDKLPEGDLASYAGKKVPAQVSVKLSGPGFTPTFYPHRDNKR